jgi:hypothetical protein
MTNLIVFLLNQSAVVEFSQQSFILISIYIVSFITPNCKKSLFWPVFRNSSEKMTGKMKKCLTLLLVSGIFGVYILAIENGIELFLYRKKSG